MNLDSKSEGRMETGWLGFFFFFHSWSEVIDNDAWNGDSPQGFLGSFQMVPGGFSGQ